MRDIFFSLYTRLSEPFRDHHTAFWYIYECAGTQKYKINILFFILEFFKKTHGN